MSRTESEGTKAALILGLILMACFVGGLAIWALVLVAIYFIWNWR